MDKRVKRISQIGVVVWDLNKAVEKYKKHFGLTDWDYADISQVPVDMEINNRPGKLNINTARTEISDGLYLELMQPNGEGEFMDYLKEHGPGIHHFTFIMNDNKSEFPKVMGALEEDGYEPFVRAKMVGVPEGMGMDLVFMDLREEMGSIIEFYNEDKE